MILMHNSYDFLKNNNLTRSYKYDVGYDIKSPYTTTINPGASEIIDTGLHVSMHEYVFGIIKSRSGIAIKCSCECSNGGVIDPGYTGSINVKIYNYSNNAQIIIKKEDRFCQMVLCLSPEGFLRKISHQRNWEAFLCLINSLDLTIQEQDMETWPQTERGEKGVGSTGTGFSSLSN